MFVHFHSRVIVSSRFKSTRAAVNVSSLLKRSSSFGEGWRAVQKGKPNDPAWALNLRACPKAGVALAGRPVEVTARELSGPEYDRMWRELLEFWPGYAMERHSARRPLPVFLLSEIAR